MKEKETPEQNETSLTKNKEDVKQNAAEKPKESGNCSSMVMFSYCLLFFVCPNHSCGLALLEVQFYNTQN